MPKLDLRAARQIKGPMGEVIALKGPGYSWAKQMPVSAYYGIGPGQIPGDWRIDEAALDGTTTRVRNDGGAGALFALAGNAPPAAMFVETGGATLRALTIANGVDLVDVHFLTVLDYAGSGGAILSRNVGQETYLTVTGSQVQLREGASFFYPGAFTRPVGPAIFELRWDGVTASAYLNGAAIGSAPLARSAWTVNYVGRGRGDRPLHAFNGRIGRCISVVLDPARGPDSLEPAVLAARATLAQQYGITLP